MKLAEVKDQILFSPNSDRPCFNHLKYLSGMNQSDCRYMNCEYSHNRTPFIEIYKLLCRARRRLDIAMFNFTHEKLAELLIFLHNKNITIRIITNYKCDNPKDDKIPALLAAKIKVKANEDNDGLMHNKYAIIDSGVLIHGSANWSSSGFNHNAEAIIITRQKETIDKFEQEFNRLWSRYPSKSLVEG